MALGTGGVGLVCGLTVAAISDYYDSMASKPQAPRNNKGADRPNGLHVITLRIDASSKAKLQKLALRNAKASGGPVSYNATILQLINEG